MKIFLILTTILIISSVTCIDINHHDCGHGEVISVVSEKCEDRTCALGSGDTLDFNVTFVPKISCQHVKAIFFMELLNSHWPLATIGNFCGFLGLECPVEAGKSYQVNFKQSIHKWLPLPKMSLNLGIKLLGTEKEGFLMCLQIPIRTKGLFSNNDQSHNEL